MTGPCPAHGTPARRLLLLALRRGRVTTRSAYGGGRGDRRRDLFRSRHAPREPFFRRGPARTCHGSAAATAVGVGGDRLPVPRPKPFPPGPTVTIATRRCTRSAPLLDDRRSSREQRLVYNTTYGSGAESIRVLWPFFFSFIPPSPRPRRSRAAARSSEKKKEDTPSQEWVLGTRHYRQQYPLVNDLSASTGLWLGLDERSDDTALSI